ncbi:hypothetical protein [Massilia aerilata]|uniref:Uncharacterized protein n=1 Tax=Massilia aerilata TaxID=453817 RepID=A0ABW0RRV9_9BURK
MSSGEKPKSGLAAAFSFESLAEAQDAGAAGSEIELFRRISLEDEQAAWLERIDGPANWMKMAATQASQSLTS